MLLERNISPKSLLTISACCEFIPRHSLLHVFRLCLCYQTLLLVVLSIYFIKLLLRFQVCLVIDAVQNTGKEGRPSQNLFIERSVSQRSCRTEGETLYIHACCGHLEDSTVIEVIDSTINESWRSGLHAQESGTQIEWQGVLNEWK